MIRRSLVPLVLLLLALAPAPLRADDAKAPSEPTGVDLAKAVADYVHAGDAAKRLELGVGIVARGPEPSDLAAALAKAWTWDAEEPRGEVVDWEQASADGKTHTVFAYAPKEYTPEKAWPLLVWLHGGVSRPSDGGGKSGVAMFKDEADRAGFLVLSPSAQPEALWWTPAGLDLLRGSLREMARRYRIDPARVALSGFSDGGSGCFYVLAHDPTAYACFLPMMGNPIVGRIYGGPTWSSNVSSRPVYAVNGGKDPLYPAARMAPIMDELRDAGCDLTWIEEPESGHEPSFLAQRWNEMHDWWLEHTRDALPKRITWATSVPHVDGRFAWVEIVSLDEKADAAEIDLPEEMEIPRSEPRPRLGIVLEPEFPGPGVRIREVQEGTPAAEAGFEAGDVILKIGDERIASFEEIAKLRDYLQGLDDEDGLFTVRRGEETLEIETRPKVLDQDRVELKRPKELGYDVSPGLVVARNRGGNVLEIQTRGVGTLRLHLAEPMIDFSKELVVRVNGKERFRGTPPQDAAVMLAEAVLNVPGGPLYRGTLDVDLSKSK